MAGNRRIVLAQRPTGMPTAEDFRLETADVPAPGEGEVLLRARWLSLDPYMRGRMSAAKSYAKPVEIGEAMTGGTVSEVVESRAPGLSKGDMVVGLGGWQEYAVLPGREVQKIDPGAFPPSYALGVLGMPGLTAYVGLLDIGQPKAGETVVVSAAAGAVGSLVGQIARIKGCRTVGIAGGPDKCDHVVRTLGFDACVDYKAPDFMDRLREACPDGIDVHFDNVGGDVSDACLSLMNTHGRMPVCGRIANYNDNAPPPGPNKVPMTMGLVLVRRLKIQGFIIFDHAHRAPDFHRDMSQWLREGRIVWREDVVEGLESAPEAFIGLLQGRNLGKLLVRIA